MTARRGSARGQGIAAALALALGAPGVAQADAGEPERKAAAQALFEEARALVERGDFAAACPKYDESYRLDPTMGTRFYEAECLERLGKLASAWIYYLEVAEAARAAGLQEREAYARDRAAALRPRLPTLAVTVSKAAQATRGIAIQRDGIALGEAQWRVAVPVDPGEHVVRAAAPGKRTWEARVRAASEREALTVEVPALEDAPPPPARAAAAPPAGPQALAPGQATWIAGAVLGAAGLAGIGLGAVFGAQAISKQDQSDAGPCDAQGYCDSRGLALRRDAIDAATGSTVAFVVGGALLAGGVALVLVAPSARDPAAGSAARPAAVALTVGAGSLALAGRF